MCLAVNDYKKCELNSKSKLHRVSVGSGGNGTYSATSIPGYSLLTADNFAFVVTSYSGGGGMTGRWNSTDVGRGIGLSTSGTPSISYNSSKFGANIAKTLSLISCILLQNPPCLFNIIQQKRFCKIYSAKLDVNKLRVIGLLLYTGQRH